MTSLDKPAFSAAAALADITSLLKEAGELALKNQSTVRKTMKEGEQIVTETDLAISKLAQERLSRWLSQPEHILLDEESIANAGSPQKVFANTQYQWALDPIDGTACYAMGRRSWGISLGVIVNGRPAIGAIYLPSVKEFYATDGVTTWQLANAFTPAEVRTTITCKPMILNGQVFVETSRSRFLRLAPEALKKIWANTPESAVEASTNVLAGRSGGCTAISTYAVWDITASLALALNAGFTIRNMKTGNDFTTVGAESFKSNWKLAADWLICHENNFEYLNDALSVE